MNRNEYIARVAWLRRYGDAMYRQRLLARRLAEARAASVRITPVRSSARVQSRAGASAAERAVERIEAARRQVQAQERVRKALYAEIFPAIAALPDAEERRVLCGRYLRGQSVQELAAEMGISERWVRRLHRNAVENLSLDSSAPTC